VKKRFIPAIGKLSAIYIGGKFGANGLSLTPASAVFASSVILGKILEFLGIY